MKGLNRIPFNRTIEQFKSHGLSDTSSMILAISLKYASENMKYIPKEATVKVNNSKMRLCPRQGGISRDLFIHKKREPLLTDCLIHSFILREGDVVLDIGANIGYYALVESQIVGKTGKVYAVEPVSSTFELLEENLQVNNANNVSSFNFAFGEKDGDSEIYVCNESNLCTMKKNTASSKIVSSQTVPVETVDSFLKDKRPPNLIRMDVEGYEYEIFKGMTETIKGNSRILMEFHYGRPFIEPADMTELFRLMEKNNFRVRFAIFEDKAHDNRIVRSLLTKAGYSLPFVFLNISINELQKLLETAYNEPPWPSSWPAITGRTPISPNVLLEKVSTD
jgi:FkbM family methyltransferase